MVSNGVTLGTCKLWTVNDREFRRYLANKRLERQRHEAIVPAPLWLSAELPLIFKEPDHGLMKCWLVRRGVVGRLRRRRRVRLGSRGGGRQSSDWPRRLGR